MTSRGCLLRSHPTLAWVVERSGTLLIRCDTRETTFLIYPDAALWDLLSRGTPWRQAMCTFAAVTGLEPGATEALARRIIERWMATSLLVYDHAAPKCLDSWPLRSRKR